MDSRGNRDDTREKPYDNEHGRPVPMPSGATGGYKETKFHLVGAGIGVAHSTVSISKTIEL